MPARFGTSLAAAVWLTLAATAATAATAAAQGADHQRSPLTVAQLLDKNAAARGGRAAWRDIHSIAWSGRAVSDSAPGRVLPFVLEQQRPNKVRFVVTAQNQQSVRVFDGTDGWKLRPGQDGVPDVQSYSADEVRFARDSEAIEGPLMDDANRGASFEVGGTSVLDGRRTYVATAHLPDGAIHRIWVDAGTFLEQRLDREFLNARSEPVRTSVRYRQYRTVDGVLLPSIIETDASGGSGGNKLIIERIALNPLLDDHDFLKPTLPVSKHHGVAVDTRAAMKTGRP